MKGESDADNQVKASTNADTTAAAVALERFGLQSKTCVVTGGTKGIGAAIVFEIASLKAKVINKQVSMSTCLHCLHVCNVCMSAWLCILMLPNSMAQQQ